MKAKSYDVHVQFVLCSLHRRVIIIMRATKNDAKMSLEFVESYLSPSLLGFVSIRRSWVGDALIYSISNERSWSESIFHKNELISRGNVFEFFPHSDFSVECGWSSFLFGRELCVTGNRSFFSSKYSTGQVPQFCWKQLSIGIHVIELFFSEFTSISVKCTGRWEFGMHCNQIHYTI